MTHPTPLSPDVLGTPEGIANPYPAYRAHRDSSPVRYLRLPANAATTMAEPQPGEPRRVRMATGLSARIGRTYFAAAA